ncbi:hypothetical protein O3M35_007081 [Rhynocoris fuscipes]|uniref:Tetratricopeptide repeat protein 12 n=1 Tax=Rhynocoris fuscipes TaxID=488301 RepID=A0AAW1D824_9HEMI
MFNDDQSAFRAEVEEELARMKEPKEGTEFDNFMRKVTNMESIISGLTSNNVEVAEKAMIKADLFINDLKAGENIDVDKCEVREKTNRTVINQAAFDELKNEPEDNKPHTMSPEAFMKSVEKDANERAQDRRDRKIISDRHKLAGNKAFREKDYEKALVCYNKAITATHDSGVLYTNRALTCLKLGLNQRALDDAVKAQSVNRKSVKAIVYEAEALYNLGRYEKSEKVISEGCKLMPDKENFLRG